MTRRLVTALATSALALGLYAGPAVAADLDTLRQQGVIAERHDGFVEIRADGSDAARAVVERVNSSRRDLYEQRADSQGVPVEQVGRVYAQQILERLPEGAWFLKPNGNYVQK
jgi:uncharacterized protein YdbL (DUF1318 family)